MPAPAFTTGMEDLDGCLPGASLQPGWLVLLAGASESGKTALAVRLAQSWAERGQHTLYLTLKDSPTEISGRLAAQSLGLGPEEARRLGVTLVEPGQAVEVAELALDEPERMLEQIGLRIAEDDVVALVVDDLGSLDDGRGGEGRRAAALSLSRLARRSGCLILALDDGGGAYAAGMPAPELTTAADVVLFTSRPGHLAGWPSGQGEDLKGLVGLELKANRHGPEAVTELHLDEGLVR